MHHDAVICCGACVCSSRSRPSRRIPNRPVRIVIGFGPGSVADIAARVIGARMSQTLGQQIVVENRAGAGSNLGAEYVTRAAKDGYTLFMATIANTINPAMGPLPFDFAKDLTPVTLVASSPQLLVAHPSLGVNTRAGADRAGEGEARHHHLRDVRHRHAVESLRPAAQPHGGHQAGAGALSRQRAGRERRDRRPRAADVRLRRQRAAARAGRHAQGAGGDAGEAARRSRPTCRP